MHENPNFPMRFAYCYNESCMVATGALISVGSSFFTTTRELFWLALSREML
jgi:hypothetical protein